MMSAAEMTTERQPPATGQTDTFRQFRRVAVMGLGWVFVIAGLPIAILPWVHIVGILMMVVGLAMILRNSFGARRKFVQLQKKHPGWLFPLRRLLRREPEILPVAWQQLLRTERLFLRHLRWQFLRKLRRRFRRRANVHGV
jgi:hypothetical protein